MNDNNISVLAVMKNAERLGVDTGFLLACMTIVQEKTQRSMNAVANDFSRLLSRFYNIAEGAATDDNGDDLTAVEKICNEHYVYVRKDDGTMFNFETVLNNLHRKWDYLNCIKKTVLISVIGGEQLDTLMVLMEKYDAVCETARYMNFAGEMVYGMYQNNMECFNTIIGTALNEHSKQTYSDENSIIGKTVGSVLESCKAFLEKSGNVSENHIQN